MKQMTIILLLPLLGYSVLAGVMLLGVTKTPEGRIVGGYEASPHSRPYQVSLQIRFLWVKLHICGGSLLNENWILTAGHCIKESWLINWLPMDAIAGAHDVNNFGPKVQISKIEKRIAHPLYKGGIGAHDIAVLKVATPFTFTKEVQPIQLPTQTFKSEDVKSLLILSGWGALRTSFFPDMPNKLQEVQVPLISYDECYKAIDAIKDPDEKNPLDKESNICTGPLTGGIAACNGDSGGPLVQLIKHEDEEEDGEVDSSQDNGSTEQGTNDSSTEANDIERPVTSSTSVPKGRTAETEDLDTSVLLGVVSWGASPCGDEGAPTVYTKVSTQLDFINSYINE